MATEKLNEQEIQLRKRARRRLVGAVALVLLMVTVLPMVLDDRQAQAPQPEIAVSIPSQDNGDFASRIVPVTPPADSPEAAPPEPVKEAPPAPAERAKAETAPPPAPASAPEKAPVAKVETKSVQEKPSAEAPKEVAAKEISKEVFSVQVGVYSDAAKVEQLRTHLAKDGFKAYTESVNTAQGSKIRLRVGPYSSRAEAEKSRDKLKTLGMTAIVVPGK